MSDTALCSVIMPCFRMGEYVATALESVASQTYPHWEVIVVDDCSPDDGTRAIVQEFQARYPARRIAFVRHAENRGVSAARRTAYLESRGKYLAFLDPDDFYAPDKLARHVDILERHPQIVMVHGGINAIDCDDDTKHKLETGFQRSARAEEYSLRKDPLRFLGNSINNSTVVCRRSAVNSDDFPHKLIFQAEDWFLWLRLADRGSFYFDPAPCTHYRWHPQSFSARVYEQPGGSALAFMEVLAALYAGAPPEDKTAIAEGMVAQLNRLIADRGMTSIPPIPSAGSGLWRVLSRTYIKLMARRFTVYCSRKAC